MNPEYKLLSRHRRDLYERAVEIACIGDPTMFPFRDYHERCAAIERAVIHLLCEALNLRESTKEE